MMITQIDLKEIARILHNLKPFVGEEFAAPWLRIEQMNRYAQWEQTVESFARMLEQNNPKFKQDVFYAACGYTRTGGSK